MEYLVFDRYKIDLKHLTLLKDGKVIPLKPKVVETLLALAEHKGRILSKRELMDRLWPDTFVEEANLKQNISLLRKALDDKIEAPVYIETIPKRGYRFLADAYLVDESDVRIDKPADPVSATGLRKTVRKKWIFYILAGLSVIILTGVAMIQAFRQFRPAPPPPGQNPQADDSGRCHGDSDIARWSPYRIHIEPEHLGDGYRNPSGKKSDQ